MPTQTKIPCVDLNADMGEGFGPYRMGDDEGILKIVTSANVACGFHAGDPETMAKTFRTAKQQGVNVGAHPGFDDLSGFGRRVIPCSPAEIERLVAYQIGAAQALSAYAGNPITYVKAHGALGNLSAVEEEVASAIAGAIKAVDANLICITFAGSLMEKVGQERGLRTCAEIFADRAYTDEGQLVSRKLPGAVLHDSKAVAARVLRMVQAGAVETISGKQLRVPIETICVHSDTPGALEMAAEIRRTLEAAGVEVKPFARGQ
ncbi:LamB/YcsF family protein [Cupriavidus sp. PET2-C1]